ncbi:MAG TPA: TylF/MycF/NovP-related O-methyltransferase, partial [Actinomycetota bacterium]|nr:TylF/MycF/NovP-related O-methyltransferase [Actinomycetota bacterium]
MIWRFVTGQLGRRGFDVVKRRSDEPSTEDDRLSDFTPRQIEIWDHVKPFTLTSPERVYVLMEAIAYLARSGIQGAIVECGVWRGGSMMAAALTLQDLEEARDLWLFDTFEGMTPPGPEDIDYQGRNAESALAGIDDHYRATVEEVEKSMISTGYPREGIHLVKGRVEETIPVRAPDRIALLRLDTDWYESTAHELEHLYPRLVRGGVLIVDDYGHWQGSRKA